MLRTCQRLYTRELSEDELKVWLDFLREFTVPELRYAFDNWTRNSRYFPHPKDVIDQVQAYRVTQARTGYPNCDAMCSARHGRGYHTNDILWLFKRYTATKDTLSRPLTNAEIEDLLTQLDSKREGGAPSWRRK